MVQSMRAKSLKRWEKLLAAPVIAVFACVVAMMLAGIPAVRSVVRSIDTSAYDAFYKLRPAESQLNGELVIIAVDQFSIDQMAAADNHYRWPWPREYWGALLGYLQNCGARAVVFDLLFEEPSNYNRETNDDQTFADALDSMRIPVIHATLASKSTTQPTFAPPVKRAPLLGAADVIEDRVIRTYEPYKGLTPSLAVQTVLSVSEPLPRFATAAPFLLHYYGPTKSSDGNRTFPYISASSAIRALFPATPGESKIDPGIFKDKIVLIGATAAATFDLKSAPVASTYPSVEAQATAIANLLHAQHVTIASTRQQFAIGVAGALLAALGAVMPRRVRLKLPISLAGPIVVFLVGYMLFTAGGAIVWLPITALLLATILAIVAGLAWTYFAEDRQRRILLQFLSQYVSPEVAAELQQRGEISLGGQRREMTVMFTDIEGFTSVADRLPVEQLENFMNTYLSGMASLLFEHNATVDKFIGDAIMSFWNAPLGQPQHAELACRAALAMREREKTLRTEFAAMGITGNLRTRIGINTGIMAVGNVGSEQKVNYTVMGDSVNVASRLEGSNKLYGSSILVAAATVQKLDRSKFVFRKLDRLRVRGKSTATEVFELLAEASSDPSLSRLAQDFETALELYFKQDWASAERILIELLAQFPEDGPTRTLLERARAFQQHPPGAGWDGVFDAEH